MKKVARQQSHPKSAADNDRRRPASKRTGKPASKPTGKSATRPASKPPYKPTDKPASKSVSEKPGEFRLQKFLASAGLGSRRTCEELIRTGRITVDGLPIENPGINIDPLKQVIEYDGERLKPEPHKYFVLNKPKGVLCTNSDPAGRTRVIDLFQREKVRLFPVGRLDEESEGLLIVTNDGDFANLLAHPRYRVYRTYRVQVVGFPTDDQLRQLREGIFFREGKFKLISSKRLNKQGKSCFLEIVLGEGHNREVRRLFARIGHKVLKLERIAFGPVKLGNLKSGAYRVLSKKEQEEFHELLERNRQTPSPDRPKRQDRSPRKPTRQATADEQKNYEQNEPPTAGAKPGAKRPVKKRIVRPDHSPRQGGGKSAEKGTEKQKRPPAGRKRATSTKSPTRPGHSKAKTYEFHEE